MMCRRNAGVAPMKGAYPGRDHLHAPQQQAVRQPLDNRRGLILAGSVAPPQGRTTLVTPVGCPREGPCGEHCDQGRCRGEEAEPVARERDVLPDGAFFLGRRSASARH